SDRATFSLSLLRHPPAPRLFPYTTLFRSPTGARSRTPGRCSDGAASTSRRRGVRAATRPPHPSRGSPRSPAPPPPHHQHEGEHQDRKSTRLNSSHVSISYAVFCLKKKKYY